MNKLPINFVMFTSTSGHFGFDTYKTTVKHYKSKLGGSLNIFQQLFAHIKVKPTERDRLPEIIDFLLENDIKPIVTEGHWERGLSHGHEYLKDQFKVYNTDELHLAPYTFFTEDDEPLNIRQGTASDYITTAINVLASNKDVLNIRFQRDGVQNITNPINNILNRVDTTDFQPFIARTRDLFLIAKGLRDNSEALQNVQCEAAFKIVSDSLSYSPIRHLCFNPALVSSHHIGAPNYTEIIKSPEFSNLNSSAPVITKWQP